MRTIFPFNLIQGQVEKGDVPPQSPTPSPVPDKELIMYSCKKCKYLLHEKLKSGNNYECLKYPKIFSKFPAYLTTMFSDYEHLYVDINVYHHCGYRKVVKVKI